MLFFALTAAAELLAAEGSAIEVTASPRRLNVDDWKQDAVGDLWWRGGLELIPMSIE